MRIACRGVLMAVFAAAAACREAPSSVVRLPPPPAVRPELPCTGGLLCEDRQRMAGFRVPRDCVRNYSGPYLQTCSVSTADMAARVREFVFSRYPWAETAADGSFHIQAAQATLHVTVRGDRATFLAAPSSAMLPAASSPAAAP